MLSCYFEAFSEKFTEKFSFYSKIWLSQKEKQKYSESLFFITILKMGNQEDNSALFKQLFFIKPVKGTKY